MCSNLSENALCHMSLIKNSSHFSSRTYFEQHSAFFKTCNKLFEQSILIFTHNWKQFICIRFPYNQIIWSKNWLKITNWNNLCCHLSHSKPLTDWSARTLCYSRHPSSLHPLTEKHQNPWSHCRKYILMICKWYVCGGMRGMQLC